MEKEIIIERKKSKSIRISLFVFIITLIMILPIVFYFADFDFITSDIPLVVVIIAIIVLPVLIWTTIYYFKQIFNNKPVLIVNENGIEEGMSTYSTGLIKWEDIEDVTIIPYMDNTYFIGILLKRPEKYIKNEKLLNRLNKQKSTKKWGHVRLSSIYFKKEFKDVVNLISYYWEQSKNNEYHM